MTNMLVIAHRGVNREETENSWSAFNKAIEIGADRIELDVYLTKDQHLVVLHDEQLNRILDIDSHVSQITRNDLKRLQLKNGEPVPFLDQVLERLLPKIELNIEIKYFSVSKDASDPMEQYRLTAENLAKLVKQFMYKERVTISSFATAPLIHLAENHPEIPRACLWYKKLYWPFSSFQKLESMMTQCKSHIVHPELSLVNKKFVEQARRKNWEIYPYAHIKKDDSEVDWERLHELGIEGFCTNHPREMLIWLKNNKNNIL